MFGNVALPLGYPRWLGLRQCLMAAVLAAGFLQGGPVAAQQNVATYSKEAMDDLGPLLRKASNNGFSMESRTSTIFGCWLPRGRAQGNEVWVPIIRFTDMDPNKTYRVVAAGDNEAIDLDLRIVDPDGMVIARDEATSRCAEVTFRPTRRQEYTVLMRLYNSNDSCVCIGAILVK